MMCSLEMKVRATVRDVFVVQGYLVMNLTKLSRAFFLALELTLQQFQLALSIHKKSRSINQFTSEVAKKCPNPKSIPNPCPEGEA